MSKINVDQALALLLQHLQSQATGHSLWFADEQHNGVLSGLAEHHTQLTLLSNRFDVAQQAVQAGIACQFSDWCLEGEQAFARVYLRICKEKPVNLHLLRLARNALGKQGQLLLAGHKNEGIKTLAKQAEEIFGAPCSIKKNGAAYLAQLTKPTDTEPLDLCEYHQLYTVAQWGSYTLQSKHGVYGWNKIDRGSELLVEVLYSYHQQHSAQVSSLLDIGCGYGFLSIAAADLPCSLRVATDNNAAALLCMEANAGANNLQIEVVSGDCADRVQGQFDMVLCNPPFHKGFEVETDLKERFLRAAARKTRKGGTALFVVNSFIPLERHAAGMFGSVEVVTNNGQFKVVALRH